MVENRSLWPKGEEMQWRFCGAILQILSAR